MNQALFILLFFILICSQPLSLLAQKPTAKTQHPIDLQLNTCLQAKTGQSTADMVSCTSQAQVAWDKELNTYYKLLMALLKASEKEKLKQSQRNWLTFRESETIFIGNSYGKLNGTMYRAVAALEQMELVKQRALQLKNYYETLKPQQ